MKTYILNAALERTPLENVRGTIYTGGPKPGFEILSIENLQKLSKLNNIRERSGYDMTILSILKNNKLVISDLGLRDRTVGAIQQVKTIKVSRTSSNIPYIFAQVKLKNRETSEFYIYLFVDDKNQLRAFLPYRGNNVMFHPSDNSIFILGESASVTNDYISKAFPGDLFIASRTTEELSYVFGLDAYLCHSEFTKSILPVENNGN